MVAWHHLVVVSLPDEILPKPLIGEGKAERPKARNVHISRAYDAWRSSPPSPRFRQSSMKMIENDIQNGKQSSNIRNLKAP